MHANFGRFHLGQFFSRIKVSTTSYPCSSVNLCSISQEDSDDVGLIGSGGQMQGCLTSNCLGVRVCAVLDQVDDDVHVSHEGWHVKGCQAGL